MRKILWRDVLYQIRNTLKEVVLGTYPVDEAFILDGIPGRGELGKP
jgi:hypothetical protein